MKTASCINSAVCGGPSSFPRCMTLPWEASLWLLVVSNPSLCRSLVRSLSLVWAHPSGQALETV